jgi:integrase
MAVRKRIWKTSSGETREAWVVDYTDSEGRHIETFAKKKDADAYHDRVRQDVRHGIHISGKLTVAEAGRNWVDNAAKGVGRPDGPLERATVKGYRETLDLHIAPLIGSMPIAKLDAESVRKLEKKLIDGGRSKQTIKRVLQSLSSILADAGAPRNAVRDRPRYKKSGRDDRKLEIGKDIPTPQQVSAILHHAPARWRTLLVVAAFTGLRASELRGLQYEDIDLKNNEVNVTRRADRYRVIGSPKSKTSRRKVPFGPIVANALRAGYVEAGGKGLVFGTSKGTIVEHSNLVKASIIPAAEAAGVPQYTGLHCLRHFYASWCIDRKIDAKVIQERMGHSSITMTFDRYGHLFPRRDDAEIDAAERAVMDATQTQHAG